MPTDRATSPIDMRWLAYITIVIASFDLFVNHFLSFPSWLAISQDRKGPRRQKQASWWIGVVASLVLPGIRILDGVNFLVATNDNADPRLIFSLTITALVVKMFGDAAALVTIVWHWMALRGHASHGWRLRVTTIGTILPFIWILLVLASGGIKIWSKSRPSHQSRISASPGTVLAYITNIGLPLVTYIPFFGMLVAWTKHPDFTLRLRDLIHNQWALGYLFWTLFHTGINTFLVVIPASALGRRPIDDPWRLVIWLCLLIGVSLVSTRLKWRLVQAQSRTDWIWTTELPDGLEEIELASEHGDEE